MKKTLIAVLIRVGLAIILAFLVASLKWRYFLWGEVRVQLIHTFFYQAGIVFIATLILSAVLYPIRELYKSGQLPIGQEILERRIRAFQTFVSRRSTQFIFWGILIAGLVGFTWTLGLLRDKEFSFNQIEMPKQGKQAKEGSSVDLLNYFSKNNNQLDYLRSCARMVGDLKAVGAKVIIVPLPYLQSEEALRLVEEIHRSGTVVFAAHWTSENNRYLLRARQESGIRVGRMVTNVFDRNPFRYSYIQSIEPRPSEIPSEWKNVQDVSFEALRVYRDIPESEEMRRDGSDLILGGVRYPIANDGKVYLGRLRTPSFSGPNAGFDIDWMKETKGAPRFAYASPRWLGEMEIHQDLHDYQKVFKGKVIMILWSDLGGIGRVDYFFWETLRYIQLIDHLIHGEVLTYSPPATFLMVMISIFGCGVILYRFRLVSSVACLILLSAPLFFAGAWLFQEEGILIDIPAVIAGFVASVAVFTVLRLGHEWRASGHVMAPSPETAGVQPAVAQTGSGFFRRHIRVSPAVAVGLVVLIVALTAIVVRAIDESPASESQKEVIYVTSLPTVEVQGLPTVDRTVKQ